MVQPRNSYEGAYVRFETPSKKVGSLMTGADDIVGNDYTVEMRVEDGMQVAWLKNRFGADRAFFDQEASERIQLALAQGKKVRALLSFLAYTDAPEPGSYWGEMAVFCYDPSLGQPMEDFIDRIAAKLAEGVRPDIDMGPSGVDKALTVEGWVPKGTVPLPKKEQGMAIMKDHQSLNEKMVEQGRAGNKGCYAISWILIVVIVVLVIWGAGKLFGLF